jgi:hypothetical protein
MKAQDPESSRHANVPYLELSQRKGKGEEDVAAGYIG